MQLKDYLYERTMKVVVNGLTSSKFPIEANVPQGSAIGTLLCNTHFNNILQLIPNAQVYAGDCTLTVTCNHLSRKETAHRINIMASHLCPRKDRGHVHNAMLGSSQTCSGPDDGRQDPRLQRNQHPRGAHRQPPHHHRPRQGNGGMAKIASRNQAQRLVSERMLVGK